jgi:hypothetical protein
MPNEDSAAQRARWLGELAEALDEARQVIKQLGGAEAGVETVDLCARIEAVKLEVQTMRVKRSGGGGDFSPEWTKGIPWRLSA